jgi:HAE1 family hydrophobic/amphiphilic exporter-1
MTTGTTIFGLMPLVLNPGAGSELYRGLGVVMFGGLLLGTVTTLVFIPAVMSLMIDLVGTLRRVKPARVTHPSMKAALPGDD